MGEFPASIGTKGEPVVPHPASSVGEWQGGVKAGDLGVAFLSHLHVHPGAVDAWTAASVPLADQQEPFF